MRMFTSPLALALCLTAISGGVVPPATTSTSASVTVTAKTGPGTYSLVNDVRSMVKDIMKASTNPAGAAAGAAAHKAAKQSGGVLQLDPCDADTTAGLCEMLMLPARSQSPRQAKVVQMCASQEEQQEQQQQQQQQAGAGPAAVVRGGLILSIVGRAGSSMCGLPCNDMVALQKKQPAAMPLLCDAKLNAAQTTTVLTVPGSIDISSQIVGLATTPRLRRHLRRLGDKPALVRALAAALKGGLEPAVAHAAARSRQEESGGSYVDALRSVLSRVAERKVPFKTR